MHCCPTQISWFKRWAKDNTRNYIQYLVTTCNGKESEKENIYINTYIHNHFAIHLKLTQHLTSVLKIKAKQKQVKTHRKNWILSHSVKGNNLWKTLRHASDPMLSAMFPFLKKLILKYICFTILCFRVQQSESVIHIHMTTRFYIPFPPRSPQTTE